MSVMTETVCRLTHLAFSLVTMGRTMLGRLALVIQLAAVMWMIVSVDLDALVKMLDLKAVVAG